MERRKLLLGSGVGLITVLAGCSGEDLMAGDENDDESDNEESDDPDENGNETPNNPDEDEVDGDDKDEKNDDKEKGNQDIPGIDVDAFESLLEQQGITLETIRRNGPNLVVEVSSSDLNVDELSATARGDGNLQQRLSDIVGAASDSVTDPQAFITSIETITVSIVDEDAEKGKNGKAGLTLEVRVSWLIEFVRDELPEEELLQRITETASEDE